MPPDVPPPDPPPAAIVESAFGAHHLRQLCLRRRVYEAMWRHEHTATADGFMDDFVTTRNAALRVVRVVAPTADEPLAAYLGRLAGGVEEATRGLAGDESTLAAVAAATYALREDCAACAAGATGFPQRCLDRLVVGHFHGVVGEVRANYRRFCSGYDRLPDPTVHLSTFHDTTENGFEPIRWVNGSHRIDDRERSVGSVVRLTLHAEQADLKNLHAVPYVLFHECASHAFSGLRDGEGGRPTTDDDDSFSEGWMDFVARKLCERMADGLGLTDNWGLSDDHAVAGQELSRARTIPFGPAVTPATARPFGARRHGVEAAKDFLNWLERGTFMTAEFERDCPGLPACLEPRYETFWRSELAWETFVRISLDLNVLRDRVSARRGFVSYINNCCLNSGIPNNLVTDLEDRIRRFWLGEPVILFLP